MEYVCDDNREYADPNNNSWRLRLLPRVGPMKGMVS